MSSDKTFYVTTPIYYVNDRPHIGHAYTTIAADVIARYKRNRGVETFFLTGTDEHGQKIAEAAAGRDMTPKQLADSVVVHFKEMCTRINASNDHFVRTTDDYHEHAVGVMFKRLLDNGDIYLGDYEGYYHTADERFITDTEWEEMKDTPDAKYITTVKEQNYFFRLSKYEKPLLEYLEQNPEFVKPDYRRNEVIGYLKKGMKDLSISRTTFDWGVPVPDDPKHVIYVWIDALTNYLSALGFASDDESNYEKFWPANYHIIGKDILVFHAIYWPAMLMSAGLPLPKTIFAHGWWTANGAKISKRAGNVIDPEEMINRYGLDPFRYFLLKENTFGRDGDFSEPALITRINTELANDLGNLLHRTIGMANKYFDGVVPARPEGGDMALATRGQEILEKLDLAMNRMAFRDALITIFEYIDAANKFVDHKAPWTLFKKGDEGRDELAQVLYDLLECLRVTSVMLAPFIPETALAIQEHLGMTETTESFASCETWGQLPAGAKLVLGKPLFPRIEDDVLEDAKARQQEILKRLQEEQEAALAAAKPEEAKAAPAEEAAPEVAPLKDAIEFDDFMKLDLRVAKILSAEKHPNADKLLVFSIDIGQEEPRTLVGGLAEHYSPEELVGRNLIVVANLKPRKLRGVKSQGMLLAATDKAAGNLSVLTLLDSSDLKPGTQVS